MTKHLEMVCCLNCPKAQQFLSSECSRGEIASYSDGTKKQLCSFSCACVCKDCLSEWHKPCSLKVTVMCFDSGIEISLSPSLPWTISNSDHWWPLSPSLYVFSRCFSSKDTHKCTSDIYLANVVSIRNQAIHLLLPQNTFEIIWLHSLVNRMIQLDLKTFIQGRLASLF